MARLSNSLSSSSKAPLPLPRDEPVSQQARPPRSSPLDFRLAMISVQVVLGLRLGLVKEDPADGHARGLRSVTDAAGMAQLSWNESWNERIGGFHD